MEIRFNNISKSFGRVDAVRDFTLTVPAGKIVAILGPSGSGKSTLLSLLTGLAAPDRGEIYLDSELASKPRQVIIPPQKRHIGMVFQTLALWPHMTVRQNLVFALKGKCPEAEISDRIKQMLDALDIASYPDSYPANLSVGEQQRVALARALIIKPQIFLLDEPLSSLDHSLVKRLLPLIRRFHKEFNTTTIYVTHDQTEALTLADFVAVMQSGQLMQFDTPEMIYHQPLNKFLASFIGQANLLAGELVKPDLVKTPLGEFNCLNNQNIPSSPFGEAHHCEGAHLSDNKVLVLIRPEDLQANPNGNIKGWVSSAEFRGEHWLTTVATPQNISLLTIFTARPQINSLVSLSVAKPLWLVQAE